MKTINYIAAVGLLTTSAAVNAVDYQFDTVTRVNLGTDPLYGATIGVFSLTGLPPNSTTPTTLSFTTSGTDYDANGSRCVPIFLTMMEKPGRYVLVVTLDPNNPHNQLVSCGLEVKS